MLRLKKLSIELQEWGSDKGKFNGEISYIGENGKVTITLSPTDCEKLLPVIAQGIVSASKEVAKDLTAEALASLPNDSIKIA